MNPLAIPEIIHFLIQHGYALLFAWVLADQLGLPIPVFPVLLAVGALAGSDQFSLAAAIPLAMLASLLGGLLWYEIGRRHGDAVLRLLCRFTRQPEDCMCRSEKVFLRHGRSILMWARFVPSLSAIVASLAGIFRMPRLPFLLFSALGALLWAGGFMLLGYLFSAQLEQAAQWFGHLRNLLFVLGFILFLYLAVRYLRRRRFLATLESERIAPEELKARLDAGEELVILDLRHTLDRQHDPRSLPGARHIPLDQLEDGSAQWPTDREVVLFCNCPHEATSARIARQLRRRGVQRARPLAGGLEGWAQKGFPLTSPPSPETSDTP